MFWNIEAVGNDIKVESPVGAMNWGIGCVAPVKNGSGYWDNWGLHVVPRSLYLKQLEDRLGIEAIENSTTFQQQESNIWNILEQWKGVGRWLSDNARLEELKVNGILIDDFDPLTTEYIYLIDTETTQIPEVTWVVADSAADATVKQASVLPGKTEVTVTAENGITKKVYTLHFAHPTGISQTSNHLIKIYPNPAKNSIWIQFANQLQNSPFSIFSVEGKKMYSGTVSMSLQSVDIKNLDPGIYFIKTGKDGAVLKFIKI